MELYEISSNLDLEESYDIYFVLANSKEEAKENYEKTHPGSYISSIKLIGDVTKPRFYKHIETDRD